MTDLDAIAAQARRRRADRQATREAFARARQAGLQSRKATRMARATELCPECSVPLGDGSTHWAWCPTHEEATP